MYLPSGKDNGKNHNSPDFLSDHDIGKFSDAECLQPDILCSDKCSCRTRAGMDGHRLADQLGAVYAVASDPAPVLDRGQPFSERTAASDTL